MPENQPSEDTCTVAEACRLLRWAPSTVQRHREELGGRPDAKGSLSRSAVMLKRAAILDDLDAVDRQEADRRVREAREEARLEVEMWRQAFEDRGVAVTALNEALGKFSAPRSPDDRRPTR